MVTSLFNVKVTFLKNQLVVDDIGNRTNGWEEYYTCYATIGGEGMASSKEKEVAGTTVEDVAMTVTVRYCKKTDAITSTGYRIRFMDELYDIVNVDHMNFKKKTLKFGCQKVRR